MDKRSQTTGSFKEKDNKSEAEIELAKPQKVNQQLKIENEDKITPNIIDIFKASRNNYGTRKIKVELKKLGCIVSRRKIGKVMKAQGLVSSYVAAQYKPHIDKCNESKDANKLGKNFNE